MVCRACYSCSRPGVSPRVPVGSESRHEAGSGAGLPVFVCSDRAAGFGPDASLAGLGGLPAFRAFRVLRPIIAVARARSNWGSGTGASALPECQPSR